MLRRNNIFAATILQIQFERMVSAAIHTLSFGYLYLMRMDKHKQEANGGHNHIILVFSHIMEREKAFLLHIYCHECNKHYIGTSGKKTRGREGVWRMVRGKRGMVGWDGREMPKIKRLNKNEFFFSNL